MSGLPIVPALNVSIDSYHRAPQRPQEAPASSQSVQTPSAPAYDRRGTYNARQAGSAQSAEWIGSYAHIQAQLLSTELGRSFRRPAASSPREAARAYGQARRRPQTVEAQPTLRAVI